MTEIELPNPKEIHEKTESSFGKHVALVTAVYAVALALTSVGGSNAMKEMILSQQQASDSWAHYQAKSIREFIAHSFKDEDTAAKYHSEKKEIEEEARKLEAERDSFMHKDHYFDYAEVFLQIAVVLASISIISVSRPVFYFSILMAVTGASLSAISFFLIH